MIYLKSLLIILMIFIFYQNILYETFITIDQQKMLSKLYLIEDELKNIDENVKINSPNIKMIPKGTIVAYNNLEIPLGWKICDGTNGTPNLIEKFILGYDENIKDKELNNSYENNIFLRPENLPDHFSKKRLDMNVNNIDKINDSLTKHSADYLANKSVEFDEDDEKNYYKYVSFFKNDNQRKIENKPPHYSVIYMMKE